MSDCYVNPDGTLKSSFLEFITKATSQYDSMCRDLATEVLALREQVATLTRQLEEARALPDWDRRGSAEVGSGACASARSGNEQAEVVTLTRQRRACSCASPDPVMQADGKFYCYTCSFETGARPSGLEPEAWLRQAEQDRAALSTLVETWRGPAAEDAIRRGYPEAGFAMQSCANELEALLRSDARLLSPQEEKA